LERKLIRARILRIYQHSQAGRVETEENPGASRRQAVADARLKPQWPEDIRGEIVGSEIEPYPEHVPPDLLVPNQEFHPPISAIDDDPLVPIRVDNPLGVS
jgi:hypothetical protein